MIKAWREGFMRIIFVGLAVGLLMLDVECCRYQPFFATVKWR